MSAAVAATTGAPEMVVAELTNPRSFSSMLAGFEAACSHEALDAPAAAWGGKCGFSIYDEEEVLREPSPQSEHGATAAFSTEGRTPRARRAPRIELLVQVPPTEQQGSDNSTQDQAEQAPVVVALELTGLLGARTEGSESRALKLVKRSCRVYDLARDSGSDCPICLEKMTSGQAAWRLRCLHQVHHACAVRYFGARGVKPLCPLCRCNVQHIDSA